MSTTHAIKKFAGLIQEVQRVRLELIREGSLTPTTNDGQQAILLGKLAERMEDSVKADFCRITMGKLPTGNLEYGGD